ncbi:hypothetical protein ROP_69710 [Rhodococcus opacus B4]|uniref:Tyr recombinase domain-containing protein n=2 Tax=Rhodococcus opacus TaxID=37919 RepID=C1B4M9_RHOOB|nr:hypothetical protein ROP_69710 [Rhodococcus opacus B4]
MSTLRSLDLMDTPIELCTPAFLHNRLQTVINPATRNKHAIALRSMLGVPLKVTSSPQRVYDLAALDVIHTTLNESRYRMYGFSMLYAGLRLGEASVKQRIKGNVLLVDRQRIPNGTITTAKSAGPVHVPAWFAQEYVDWEPSITRNNIYLGLQRTGKRASIHLSPHSLRHKFASELVKAGCPPNILKNQMRHHDVQVSLKYYVQHTSEDYSEVVHRAFGLT